MSALSIRLVNVDRMEVLNGHGSFSDGDFGGSCHGSGKIGLAMRSADTRTLGQQAVLLENGLVVLHLLCLYSNRTLCGL